MKRKLDVATVDAALQRGAPSAAHAPNDRDASCPQKHKRCAGATPTESLNDAFASRSRRGRGLPKSDRPIKESEEVADVIDYDAEGCIAGVEILDASKRTDDPDVLKQFNFDLLTVG